MLHRTLVAAVLAVVMVLSVPVVPVSAVELCWERVCIDTPFGQICNPVPVPVPCEDDE